MREIALDTETTGLDPEDGHRIVEIGCVEMISGVRTGRQFHRYINPERDMPPEAFRVHGLSEDFLKDKPLFKAVANDFMAFIGDARLVIHNASFDMKFINAELINAKIKPLPMERALDTVLMAKRKFPGSPASLDALCKRFGIDLGKRTLHGALLDAELLADVYLELSGGRQDSLWQQASSDADGRGAVSEQGNVQAMHYRPAADYRTMYESFVVLEPSEDEKQAHAAMVARLKQPLWKAYDGKGQ